MFKNHTSNKTYYSYFEDSRRSSKTGKNVLSMKTDTKAKPLCYKMMGQMKNNLHLENKKYDIQVDIGLFTKSIMLKLRFIKENFL